MSAHCCFFGGVWGGQVGVQMEREVNRVARCL
jgi:hypothetical protein